MEPKTFWVFALGTVFFLSVVSADLPSCYRARCSHCAIQFIAQMCPTTCANCPQTFGRTYGGPPRSLAHGQPTAPVYQTAERVSALGQTDGQAQTAYAQQVAAPPAQQPAVYQAPTPQQQQVDGGQSTQNQYGQSSVAQPFAPPPSQQFGQQGPIQFPPPPAHQFPTIPPMPAFNGFPGMNGAAQFSGFQPAAQQAGVGGASGMFNPFQPFLHQSFQAQGQTPAPTQIAGQQQGGYNPFTFPTFPPAPTFAPFTHAPITIPPAATFPTFPPFPTPPPATQAPPPSPQLNYQHIQQPQQPTYTPQLVQPQQPNENLNYVQSGQSIDPQRPRQVYNTQQQQVAPPQQYVNTQPAAPQSPPSYLQPARAASIPNVPVDQQARSIDAIPVQLEKQAFIGGGGGGQVMAAQCPKQPNWEPCITKELANERFRNCCQRLGEGCSQLCNYDQSLTTLQLAVLTGRCPIAKVADMMVCASGYEDASSCCAAYGVFEPGFEHCRPYCNPAAGLPNDGMLAEKYKCLGKLSQIQRCFYVSQRP